MTKRYRVEETLTVIGVGYIEARSAAEAVEKAKDGKVTFFYDDASTARRGDGIKAWPDRDQ